MINGDANQWDQMARLFVNFRPIATMKIYPIALNVD